MSKQTILDLIDGKTPENRIPVGFWWHFTPPFSVPDGTNNPELLKKTIDGHINLYNVAHPDLIKIMIEGYFTWPTLENIDMTDPEQLKTVGHADLNHPFFTEQIEMCKAINEGIHEEAATFYTVFDPFYWMLFSSTKRNGYPMEKGELADVIKQYPQEIKRVYDIMIDDCIAFSKKLMTEGKATGIFFGTFNFKKLTKEEYMSVFHEGEKRYCEEISKIRNTIMLHVCGHNSERLSDFSYYEDLQYSILNLDILWEKMTLGEAKAKFPGKIILGGYDREPDALLYNGTREEIEQAAEDMVKEAGRDRLIIGANCALNTKKADPERIRWIREKCDTL